ncbi:hypothetical protein VISP3789_11009 [Vibrio splendidus ATCC 33789]|nr:hypothetical protein VISP3789_11009 [Vibrio splendidus ATCC 33789]
MHFYILKATAKVTKAITKANTTIINAKIDK